MFVFRDCFDFVVRLTLRLRYVWVDCLRVGSLCCFCCGLWFGLVVRIDLVVFVFVVLFLFGVLVLACCV